MIFDRHYQEATAESDASDIPPEGAMTGDDDFSEGVYTVFEDSAIEVSFPATEEGWAAAIAYRDDTLKKYDAETLAQRA